jgi:predicted NUDIX family phosphoesterase
MSAPENEHVLVTPTAVFHSLGHFQGFCAEVDRYLPHLLQSAVMSFQPRAQMERDPSFKQLIPYVLIRHVDAAGQTWLFVYTRGAGQGESRLHRKRSVGIGGHISREDAAGDPSANPYLVGMRRELAEEVSIDAPHRERCVGMLNDDETEVGRVHLGIVHLLDVDLPAVTPREDDIADARFLPVEDLLKDLDGFETWSKICLDALFGGR